MLRVQLLQGYSLQHKLFVFAIMVFGLPVVNLQNQASFYTWKMFGVVVSFIGIFKSGDPEKTRGWQCLLFVDFSSFLELLPTSCGPFIFFPFILVVVNSFKNGFPLAEPSPTHNSNFPVSAVSSNNSPTAD